LEAAKCIQEFIIIEYGFQSPPGVIYIYIYKENSDFLTGDFSVSRRPLLQGTIMVWFRPDIFIRPLVKSDISVVATEDT
jgi:hypothetical protein